MYLYIRMYNLTILYQLLYFATTEKYVVEMLGDHMYNLTILHQLLYFTKHTNPRRSWPLWNQPCFHQHQATTEKYVVEMLGDHKTQILGQLYGTNQPEPQEKMSTFGCRFLKTLHPTNCCATRRSKAHRCEHQLGFFIFQP